MVIVSFSSTIPVLCVMLHNLRTTVLRTATIDYSQGYGN